MSIITRLGLDSLLVLFRSLLDDSQGNDTPGTHTCSKRDCSIQKRKILIKGEIKTLLQKRKIKILFLFPITLTETTLYRTNYPYFHFTPWYLLQQIVKEGHVYLSLVVSQGGRIHTDSPQKKSVRNPLVQDKYDPQKMLSIP